jgi:hypothetical protein
LDAGAKDKKTMPWNAQKLFHLIMKNGHFVTNGNAVMLILLRAFDPTDSYNQNIMPIIVQSSI